MINVESGLGCFPATAAQVIKLLASAGVALAETQEVGLARDVVSLARRCREAMRNDSSQDDKGDTVELCKLMIADIELARGWCADLVAEGAEPVAKWQRVEFFLKSAIRELSTMAEYENRQDAVSRLATELLQVVDMHLRESSGLASFVVDLLRVVSVRASDYKQLNLNMISSAESISWSASLSEIFLPRCASTLLMKAFSTLHAATSLLSFPSSKT